jgi:thiamine pyrophosphate-dependent acetolactate synthase large subunit-like protein
MTRRARDVLIDILRDEGITHVFGNPGSTEMPLKSLGYANAKAGRFDGMDVVDPAIDFQALAASMGVPAERANDRDAIGAAVTRALEREGPSLIEIPIR